MSYFNLVSWFKSSFPKPSINIVETIPIEEIKWDTLDIEINNIKTQQIKKWYTGMRMKTNKKFISDNQENQNIGNVLPMTQIRYLLCRAVVDNKIEIFELIKKQFSQAFREYVIRENLYQHTINWNATSLVHSSRWPFINYVAHFGTPQFFTTVHANGFKFKEDTALYLLKQRPNAHLKDLENKLKYFKLNGGYGLDNENWMNSTIFNIRASKTNKVIQKLCHPENEKLLMTLIHELSKVSNDHILVFLLRNHQDKTSITSIETIFHKILSKNIQNVITINVLREIFKTPHQKIWDFFVEFFKNHISRSQQLQIFEANEPINKMKSLANVIFTRSSIKHQEKIEFLIQINADPAQFITSKTVTQAIRNDSFKMAFNIITKYGIQLEPITHNILLSKLKNSSSDMNDKLIHVLLGLYQKKNS